MCSWAEQASHTQADPGVYESLPLWETGCDTGRQNIPAYNKQMVENDLTQRLKLSLHMGNVRRFLATSCRTVRKSELWKETGKKMDLLRWLLAGQFPLLGIPGTTRVAMDRGRWTWAVPAYTQI